MKNKDRSSSCCNNCRRQSSKRFCNFYKCFGHSIETCYRRNKPAVSVSAATVANTEAHIPSVTAPNPLIVTPDPPIDFSVQPPDTFDPFPNSPFNEQVEDA